MDDRNPIVIVMGVSGSGKSTIGMALATSIGIPFADGDDFHPEANIEKMAAGKPLNDGDRQGWLERLNEFIRKSDRTGVVIACSALKEKYRKILRKNVEQKMVWVYLKGSYEEILARMQARSDHFMPSALLQSQFDTLEEPGYALHVSISNPPEAIVAEILEKLKRPD